MLTVNNKMADFLKTGSPSSCNKPVLRKNGGVEKNPEANNPGLFSGIFYYG